MKILMVSSYLPYPLFSGGHIRLFNLIKNLNKNGHEITLVCEKRDHQGESDIKRVEEICKKVITVNRKKQWSAKNILKAGLSTQSFLSAGHNLPEMRNAIADELGKAKLDLIHVETFYVYQNLPKTKLPVVLVEHNIEYLVYKRYADKSSVFLKPLISIDVLKIRKEEERFWKMATKLVAVSPQDKEIMKREDVVVVANGVDVEKYNVERKVKPRNQERKVLFIGDFKWIQNKDAVEWIIKNIWPSVLEKAKIDGISVKFWVVGKKIPTYLKEMTDSSILFDENAPAETEKIYQEADLLLAPIRIGGGTSYKILESMATGLPVLTTFLGNEGIDGKDGQDIVVADKPEEFADWIIKLLDDQVLYENISKNARKHTQTNFNWISITKKLEGVYREAIS